VFTIPSVQTRLGSYATNKINEAYGTDIKIEKLGLQFNGDVELKNILIKDHRDSALISVAELNTSILSFTEMSDNKLIFGAIDLYDLSFHIHKYLGESDTNLDLFVAKFDKQNPGVKTNKFLLSSSDVHVYNSRFLYSDENLSTSTVLNFQDLNMHATDFLILGVDVKVFVNSLDFEDSRGVKLQDLQTNFSYTLSQMKFDQLELKSEKSFLTGQLQFDYNRVDFKEFSDKVKISGHFNDSTIDLEELNQLYDEFGVNQKAVLSTIFSGTLNDLKLDDFELKTNRNTVINGEVKFKNLFNSVSDNFEMDGEFQQISSTYTDLKALLPRVLGDRIPSNFKTLGRFDIKGTTTVTNEVVEAKMDINTDIGTLSLDLKLDHVVDIDTASYNGHIQFSNFDLGLLLEDPTIGLVTSDLRVSGRGFTKENINSNISGTFDSFTFRNYMYTNLEVLGVVKNKVFNGELTVVDPNLEFSFEGLVDFSKDENIYDFSAAIKHANLYAMKFVKRDTLSVLRGQMTMDMKGTTIDDVYGAIRFKNALYQNKNDRYDFKDFEITSEFDASNERTIQVNSPEIVQGYLKGKFAINELPNLIKNALGDIYTKFIPFKVKEGQYMNFNFKIFNKIVEIFSPQLKLGSNTFAKGRVESNPKNFKLTFRSPNIKLEEFFANKIEVQLINDNPLFNSYIEIDSLATPYYKASKFSLINVTLNDTLYVKSEFKGGKKSTDEFDLNLYYTIDENNKSVVGFKKSNATFKNTPWLINASQNIQNKIVFDRSFDEILFDHLKMSYADEEILLNAAIKGAQNKTINLDFKNVDLAKVTPSIDSLKLGGNINGKLSISQQESVYLPKSNLTIDNFEVNDFNLGSFNSNIVGDASLTNYNIEMSLLDDANESLSVYGILDVSGDDPKLNLDINFKDFILDPIAPFGKGIVTNIRGEVSGYAVVSGRLQKSQINGSLKLNQGGLSIPYLNVDYEFKDNTTINLLEQSFIFNASQLIDSEFRSKGVLNGRLSHVNFYN